MANADKTLLNKDNLEIYPLTREGNVYDENNVNLKEKFKTVVFKDNEVHQFAEELYEDSKNKISLINLNSEAKGLKISKNENDIINLKGQANQSYATWISKTPIDLETGTYTFSRTTSLNFSVILKLFNSSGVSKNYYIQPNNRITFETTEKMVAYEVWSEGIPTGVEIDVSFGVQLEEGSVMTTHEKYNPNRHITNSEAEFLKEEFGKSANELDFSDVEEIIYRGLTYSFKDNVLTLNGTTEGIVDRVFYLNSQVNANGNYVFSGNNSNISSGSYFTLSTGTDTPLQLNSTVNKSDKANVSNLSIKSLHMYLDSGVTYNNFKISFSLIKGDLEGYLPYNSSSHITNEQADLLKNEWKKNVNLIDISKMSEYYINVSTGSLTSNNWWNLSDYIEVKGSTQYTISCSYIPNNRYWQKSITYFNENKTFISGFTHNNEYDTIPKLTFTPPSNAKYVRIGWAVIQGDGINVEIKNVMLNEGPEALPYQEWNGQIIHEKDIEQIKVWENANPSLEIGYGEKTLNINNVFDYKYGYLAYYLSNNVTNLTPAFSKIKLKKGGSCFWRITQAVDNNGTIASRVFGVGYDGKLIVENCFVGGNGDNTKLIPLEFYVSNY